MLKLKILPQNREANVRGGAHLCAAQSHTQASPQLYNVTKTNPPTAQS